MQQLAGDEWADDGRERVGLAVSGIEPLRVIATAAADQTHERNRLEVVVRLTGLARPSPGGLPGEAEVRFDEGL